MELTVFEYPGCPYCRQARELVAELKQEHPAYKEISFKYLDETENLELAKEYGYYYAPSFFLGRKKLYEADPSWSRAEAKQRLEAMMAEALSISHSSSDTAAASS